VRDVLFVHYEHANENNNSLAKQLLSYFGFRVSYYGDSIVIEVPTDSDFDQKMRTLKPEVVDLVAFTDQADYGLEALIAANSAGQLCVGRLNGSLHDKAIHGITYAVMPTWTITAFGKEPSNSTVNGRSGLYEVDNGLFWIGMSILDPDYSGRTGMLPIDRLNLALSVTYGASPEDNGGFQESDIYSQYDYVRSILECRS